MKKHSVSDILLCTIGSAGDVYPFIGLGHGLRQRGFRVTLVTSQYFEPQARDAGLEFASLGSAEDYESIIQNPDLWDPEKGFQIFAKSVVLPILKPVYEIISGFDPSTTVLITQGQVFGAHIAHEKLGFQFITIHLQPAAFRSVYEFPLLPAWMPPLFKRGIFHLLDTFVLDKVFAPEINRFRASLRLPPVKKIFDKWSHSPQTQLTGFIYHDKASGHEHLSESVEQFLDAGSSPIIFTAGTAMKHANQFFADCVRACQMLGRRGILLTQYPEQLPRELPPDIQHFAYLPFSTILPRAAVLVHHGGIGTTAQAIAASIPQVIRPMAYDQPDTAARVDGLGIGASLNQKKFNAASLAEKLNTLITSSKVLDRCKFFARKISPAQSLGDTCTIIENFASDQP
jgi:UDP:flavonoid glycosyltransferase YjiC (YdhE family)